MQRRRAVRWERKAGTSARTIAAVDAADARLCLASERSVRRWFRRLRARGAKDEIRGVRHLPKFEQIAKELAESLVAGAANCPAEVTAPPVHVPAGTVPGGNKGGGAAKQGGAKPTGAVKK